MVAINCVGLATKSDGHTNSGPALGGDPSIHALLASFHEQRVGDRLSVPGYSALYPAWMVFCAGQHAAAVHRPHDTATLATYARFMQETLNQFLGFQQT